MTAAAHDTAKNSLVLLTRVRYLSRLIARPATGDRVLDLTYRGDVGPSDFAAAAVALGHTSMFDGLRMHDVQMGEALNALCACASTSRSLRVLSLSGVLAGV
jgi:hypothetical protein